MRGHTFVELTFALLLLGVATASLAPGARKIRDRAAVSAAREALVGVLTEARLAAVESGGASVRIVEGPGTAQTLSRGAPVRSVGLASEFGVTVELSGARSDVEIRYDALGLGRLASQTVVLRRGDAVAELVVSGYGRVRRR